MSTGFRIILCSAILVVTISVVWADSGVQNAPKVDNGRFLWWPGLINGSQGLNPIILPTMGSNTFNMQMLGTYVVGGIIAIVVIAGIALLAAIAASYLFGGNFLGGLGGLFSKDTDDYSVPMPYYAASHQNQYYSPQQYSSSRALQNPYTLGLDRLHILDYIAMMEETYRKFDSGDVECQQRMLCELQQSQNSFGPIAKKIIGLFGYLTYLKEFPLPAEMKGLLDQYQTAVRSGRSMKQECGKIYPNCEFSIGAMVKKYSEHGDEAKTSHASASKNSEASPHNSL